VSRTTALPGLRPSRRSAGRSIALLLLALVAILDVGCESADPVVTPRPEPGTADRPREVNVVMRDYLYVPDPIDLVPGETVRLQVVNGGLDWHEVVIGDQAVQDAWEVAEAATVGAPPGPTPAVSVPPGTGGLRLVVSSGERSDVVWTVPGDPAEVASLIFGCHIPGHYARGMRAEVRVVTTP
jgi:uncharacterized cupredoxin-like copper-binding protein